MNNISCCVKECEHFNANKCQAMNVSVSNCGTDCSKSSRETMCDTFKPKC